MQNAALSKRMKANTLGRHLFMIWISLLDVGVI
jgi:hypothetical protein